jgi:DNA-directed RNA polymerase specialized sigma subunit
VTTPIGVRKKEWPKGSGTWVVTQYHRSLPGGKEELAAFSGGTPEENRFKASLFMKEKTEELLRTDLLYDHQDLISGGMHAEARHDDEIRASASPEVAAEANRVLALLPDEQWRQIARQRWGLEVPRAEVASNLGITVDKVRYLEGKIKTYILKQSNPRK